MRFRGFAPCPNDKSGAVQKWQPQVRFGGDQQLCSRVALRPHGQLKTIGAIQSKFYIWTAPFIYPQHC